MGLVTIDKSLYDDLYDGWVQYRKTVKGYAYTPSKADIIDWEQYCDTIFNTVKEFKENNVT